MPIALLLARARFPGKGLVAGILVLPLVLPPTVLGFYLLQIFGRRAHVGHWLEQTLGVTIVFHWSGAVVASAVAAFPLFLLPARGAFEAIDPALEDVARLLGRGEWSVFAAVTFPLAWRGLAAGMVLAFRPRTRRLWSHVDGCRQHPRPHANRRAGDLRRRTGRRFLASRLSYFFDLGDLDRRRCMVVQRTIPVQGLAR